MIKGSNFLLVKNGPDTNVFIVARSQESVKAGKDKNFMDSTLKLELFCKYTQMCTKFMIILNIIKDPNPNHTIIFSSRYNISIIPCRNNRTYSI